MKPCTIISTVLIIPAALLLPQIAAAQTLTEDMKGMQPILDTIYADMLPLYTTLIDVARGIAGFGALWYIGSRVWRQLAAAEPIDVYPLLRPFALGIAIMLFPALISILNGVLQPTVSATNAIVQDSNRAIENLLKQKEAAIRNSKQWQVYVGESGGGDRAEWYKYRYPEDESGSGDRFLNGLGNDIQFWLEKQSYSFRNNIKVWVKELLELVYAAASLCINTIRIFYLLILAIIGPLILGFSVYDGFQHTLSAYLARYVNIFLWLPICNVFGSILGKIQQNMLRIDLSQIEENGDTLFTGTDTAYLIFLLIGIIGYFSVPNVAGYIVQAGGANAIIQKINTLAMSGGQMTPAMIQQGNDASTKSVADMASNYGNMAGAVYDKFSNSGNTGASQHQHDKLSGK